MTLVVKNPPNSAGDARDVGFDPWVGEISWSRKFSSIPVWKIPWTEKPGRLQSMRLQRIKT